MTQLLSPHLSAVQADNQSDSSSSGEDGTDEDATDEEPAALAAAAAVALQNEQVFKKPSEYLCNLDT